MADKKVSVGIEFKDENSPKTIKQIVEEFKSLQEQLKVTKEGTKEYQDTLKKINDVVNEFNSQTSKNTPKSIGQIRDEIKFLNVQLENTKTGTKEYFNILKRIGDLKGEMKDLRDNIKALDPGDKAKAFGNLGNTIASGFEGASRALSVFGTESKGLEKTMRTVQAAANLSDGIQSVSELGKQFDVLKTIILGNPIITISATILAIGTALFALKDKIEVVGKAFDFIGSVLSKVKNIFLDVADAVGIYNKKASELEDTLNNLKEAESGLTKEIERQIKVQNAQGKDTFELEKNKLELIRGNTQSQIDLLKQLEKEKGKLSNEEKQRLNELIQRQADTNTEIQVLEIKHQQDIEKKRKEEHQRYLERLKEKKEREEKEHQEKLQRLKDEEDAVIRSFQNQKNAIDFYSNEALKIAKITGDDELKIKEETLNAKLAAIQQEIDELQKRKEEKKLINQDELNELLRQQQSLNNDLLLLEDQKNQQIVQKKLDALEKDKQLKQINLEQDEIKQLELEIQFEQQKIEILKELGVSGQKQIEDAMNRVKMLSRQRDLAAEKQLAQEKAKFKLFIEQNTFNALNSLSNLFFTIQRNNAIGDLKKQKEIARKKFEVDKGLNMLQAVINTARGVTAAMPNIPLAVAVGIMGALQVATIASQRYQDTGDIPSEPSTPSLSTPSVPDVSAQQQQGVTTPFVPQGTFIQQNEQGDVKEGMIVRAYVVERDITDEQAKRKVIQNISGF